MAYWILTFGLWMAYMFYIRLWRLYKRTAEERETLVEALAKTQAFCGQHANDALKQFDYYQTLMPASVLRDYAIVLHHDSFQAMDGLKSGTLDVVLQRKLRFLKEAKEHESKGSPSDDAASSGQ